MRYLIDTNIFLWWLDDDRKLKISIRKIIEDSKNQVFVSIVSALEISIKHQLGKLPLKTTIEECFKVSSFEVLDIALDHVFQLGKLPLYHKDPFDRILIAQAMVENLTLVTSDQKIWRYHLPLIKA